MRGFAAGKLRLLTTPGQSRALKIVMPWLLASTHGTQRQFSGKVYFAMLSKSIMQCSTAKQIEAIVMSNPKMDHVNVAMAYRSLTKNRSTNMVVYKMLEALSTRISFPPRDLSSILHSVASNRYFNELPPLFVQKVERANVTEFSPQDISNAMWAFAKMGIINDAFFENVAIEMETRDLEQFNPQDITNIIWALAKLDYRDDALLASFAQHLLTRNLSVFEPQGFANILWACGALNYKDEAMLAHISQNLVTRELSTFTPQAIANILSACVKLDCRDDALFVRVAHHLLTRNLSTFTPQDIANITWAFAVLRVSAPAMFQCFADAVLSVPQLAVSKMTVQAVSNLLYACALVNYRNDALLNELARELCSRKRLSTQDMCNSMWAFACLNALNLKEVKRWFSKPSNAHVPLENGAFMDAGQLFQVKLAWQQTHGGDSLPALIDNICKGEWIDAALLAAYDKEYESSRVHLRIAKMLEKRFTLQNEAQLLGGVSVDIFIPKHNAVVEVDGPSHFFSNQPDVKIGATVFKHRLLERAGYKVVSVPVLEFRKADAEQYITELEERIIK